MTDKLIQRGLTGWPLFWLFALPMSGCMLAAMVLTSFPWGRRCVSQAQWKALHRSGVYFLWAYAFSVYWWNAFSYDDPLPIDYLFYAAGFCAFALRIAAWGKRRAPRVLHPGRRLLGGLAIAAGLVAPLLALRALPSPRCNRHGNLYPVRHKSGSKPRALPSRTCLVDSVTTP